MSMNQEIFSRLDSVNSSDEFEDWVRLELRRHLPHAALLVTVGKLYGVGSVPTHRISVDFPLGMIEALKNCAGALDDPLMFGWLKSEKLRFVNVRGVDQHGGQHLWRNTLLRYGIHGVMIHGILDHTARRFMIVQICNPNKGGSIENAKILSSLIGLMAKCVFGIFTRRPESDVRRYVGHPTISLTAAELHIVELIAQGLSNKEIARRRGVSDSTVKTQVQRTGAKLGATRRAEIVAIAMSLLSPLPPQTLLDYGDDEI